MSGNAVNFQQVRKALDVNYEPIKDSSIKSKLEVFEEEYNKILAKEELEELS